MSRVKQIGMAAATFGVALGVGFVMQNGDALAGRFGADGEPAAAPVQSPIDETSLTSAATEIATVPEQQAQPAVEGTALASNQLQPATDEAGEASPELAGARTVTSTEETVIEMTAPAIEAASAIAIPEILQSTPSDPAPAVLANAEVEESPDIVSDAAPVISDACVIDMTSTVQPGALVEVSVNAPCHASSPFTVHHQGMMFTAMTDETGAVTLKVPALAEVAVIIAAFPDGEGNVTTTTVPELANYDRAVLQWSGQTEVMLSAYEFGASYGAEGHITRENMQTETRATAGEGGFLLTLGTTDASDALLAEVYTFPSGMMSRDFDVKLVAEAEITESNCGQELTAQSLQVGPDGVTNALDLLLVMPECDAVGDFLILQNMFEDLTLASR